MYAMTTADRSAYATTSVQQLAPGERPLFEAMTFPMFRPTLMSGHSSLIAVGAMAGNRPAALALAVQRADDQVELLSVFVDPAFRRRGLGSQLLQALERAAKERACRQIQVVYTADVSQFDGLGALLARNGWSEPVPRMVVCKASKKLLGAPWIERYRLANDFSIAPWASVTHKERGDLERQRGEIPPTLFPFPWEQERYPLEPVNSIALRKQEKIMGWLLTHRIAPDTIRYTCAFVDPNLQRLAVGVGLMIVGIELQAAALGTESYGIWATPIRYSAMVAFIQRRMRPWLDTLRESRESRRILAAGVGR